MLWTMKIRNTEIDCPNNRPISSSFRKIKKKHEKINEIKDSDKLKYINFLPFLIMSIDLQVPISFGPPAKSRALRTEDMLDTV